MRVSRRLERNFSFYYVTFPILVDISTAWNEFRRGVVKYEITPVLRAQSSPCPPPDTVIYVSKRLFDSVTGGNKVIERSIRGNRIKHSSRVRLLIDGIILIRFLVVHFRQRKIFLKLEIIIDAILSRIFWNICPKKIREQNLRFSTKSKN